MKVERFLIPLFVLTVLMIATTSAEESTVILHESFRGKLANGWKWQREDPKHWRLTDKGLEVQIQPGNMWGPANDAKNVLVRPAPDPAKEPVQITASVSHHPTSQYEQVDLVWYYDDGHMVKVGEELVDGQLSVVMGREENDRTRTISITPLDSNSVELRMRVSGNRIHGSFKTPQGRWRNVGECDLPVKGEPNISLQFYQGPADAEHWGRVSELTVERWDERATRIDELFDHDNLVAWCIVPFDAKKRTPEQRAEMLDKLGLHRFAYDWRAEHLPTFPRELEALKRHGIELTAVWFPDALNDDARFILQTLKGHQLKPQLWVASQDQTVEHAAAKMRPLAEEAAKTGCRLALYNHGGWFGEPENQLAIIDRLKKDGITNVGMVYNLHHGHDQVDRFPDLLEKMKPHLLALNLNGMTKGGDKAGKEILPIGQGELDLQLLKTIVDSGYHGPIGILNHTPEDAEARLRENLAGLDRLVQQLKATPQAAPQHAQVDPQLYGPLPSDRQLRWHELEFYGFLHFTVNTFTDKEWGYGDEDEKVFNPTDFDAEQIATTAQQAGMKGLILTCKHHDGFCLWPSKFTEHSVKNSPWKGGHGDVVKEISDACLRHGLKFGVYLSPWDRNRKDYSTPAYIEYYRNQIRELLTNYGDVFEVWFDGANGGDGFYGGTRETRHIDNSTYYDWPDTWKIVRELMPGAMMFSDAGPDVRWVGNESGVAGDPCWETLDMTKPRRFPGGSSDGLNSGDRAGTAWLPAECDVSIRPGWFYHEKEDTRVKTPRQLLDIYYRSVGRGANLNLNIPPDRRGRINEHDIQALREFRRILDQTFATNLAAGAQVTASNVRGNDERFSPRHVIDGDRTKYWASDDAVTTPELVLDLGKPCTFNVIELREYLPLGQRVEAFALDQWKDGKWEQFAEGTSIGNRRLVRTQDVTTRKVRLRITKAPVCPAISEVGLFKEPRE